MDEDPKHRSKEIVTNEDKLKLALNEYKGFKGQNKGNASIILAFLSLLFSALSATFKPFLGFSSEIITYIVWTIIVLLAIYIVYMIVVAIIIKTGNKNTFTWFSNYIQGIEEIKQTKRKLSDVLSAMGDVLLDILEGIWKVIGYILYIIFILFPIIVVVLIGFWIGWSSIFDLSGWSDGQVPYAVPYFVFGILFIVSVYVYIYSDEGLCIKDPVDEFFESVFDIGIYY